MKPREGEVMNRIIGYIDVSSKEEGAEIMKKINHYALNCSCSVLFYQESIKNRQLKEELKQALKAVTQGDVFVVANLEQLTKKKKELHKIVGELIENGVHFVSLSEEFDTTTQTGQIMLRMMNILNNYEKNIMEENTKPGRVAAFKANKLGGRPPINNFTKRKIWRSYEEGCSVESISHDWNIAASTVYKVINESPYKKDLKESHKKNKIRH